MRECKIIEIICDILYYPFKLGIYEIKDLEGDYDMTKICRLCYRILTHTVKDYVINEEYVAQWIDMFFLQAMSTGEKNDIYAEPCIQAILTNNKKLLDQCISRDTIDRIIGLCIK
jgi:inositol 1,4,5-triphosphate receptor type 1